MDPLWQKINSEGFEKSHDPKGDGDCFYNAAAFQLGRDGTGLKNELFEYLTQNQYDVSFLFILFLLIFGKVYLKFILIKLLTNCMPKQRH